MTFSKLLPGIVSIVSIFVFTSPVFAHVIVKPSSAGIGSFQTFDVGVPSEKDMSTIELKLLIPKGLSEITPNVKPGWSVSVVKSDDTVTEIDWTGGEIPSGQRDDFYFSGQMPADVSTIQWKAYQTYADGSVVSWDMDPKKVKKGEEGTPFSTTNVVNDLAPANSTSGDEEHLSQKTTFAFIFSIVALITSCVSLSITRRNSAKKLPAAKKRIVKKRSRR